MSHQIEPGVLIWCDTTMRQAFETGIQRVTRRLADALSTSGLKATPVGWDTRRRLIAPLSSDALPQAEGEWLLVPEVPTAVLGEGVDPTQVGRALALRTAMIVHDLIPVKRSFDYPEATVANFKRYYRMFSSADIALATTRTVAEDLRAFLMSEGLPPPTIAVVPLPAQFGSTERVPDYAPTRMPAEPLRLLSVSTWEPRKNLPRFLRAFEAAKAAGAPIELTIVGRRNCFPEYDREIFGLAGRIPGLRIYDPPSDETLASLYAAHHVGVYTSTEEGFGLPVLESLWLGRPCVCHRGSAMGEVAPGGGTVMIDMEDEQAIAETLVRLSSDVGILRRLSIEASERPLKTWFDYGKDVAGILGLRPYRDA